MDNETIANAIADYFRDNGVDATLQVLIANMSLIADALGTELIEADTPEYDIKITFIKRKDEDS
jgi:hypothetical protein